MCKDKNILQKIKIDMPCPFLASNKLWLLTSFLSIFLPLVIASPPSLHILGVQVSFNKASKNSGCGGGPVVSVLVFYSDDQCSNPAEVNWFTT